MSKKKQLHDPHAEREASKYETPIPSRELILQELETDKTPWPFDRVCKHLDIQDKDLQVALHRRLVAMKREGQLGEDYKGRFFIPDESDLIAGTIAAHGDGYGFVITEEGEDLYLPYQEMRKVFHGDEVLATIANRDKNGRLEGQIVSVTKRHTEKCVGKLFIEKDRKRVVPDNPRIQHAIFLDDNFDFKAEHEDIVVVEITRQPDGKRPPKGIIKKVLGHEFEPGMEIEIATHNFNIPYEWPAKALEQAKNFGSEPSEHDKEHRVDLRHLSFVTIDGEDARDFDDAVYCEPLDNGGWTLWVAIADVSHYVAVNSPLDTEAINRATSVYFPGNVIPMLPENLSNGLCSLKPDVDRLTMVCEMQVSRHGKLLDYLFYEGLIHSHARLTYTEVGKIILESEDNSSVIRQDYQHVVPLVDRLHDLYQQLRKQRVKRGAIDFDTIETRIIFTEDRKIDSIIPVQRNDAHKLIEECMLVTNVATATFLQKHNIPALYRSHEGPNEKKLNNLRSFIGELGLELSGGDEPTPKDYQSLFEQIKGRDDAHLIQTMMLRSMSQAVYEPDNKGHFGLAYEAYTHFTSPIRRYPDLLVHRAIRSIIRSGKSSKHVKRVKGQSSLKQAMIYPYKHDDLVQLGEQCSMAERRADDATRDVNDWLKCEYLQAHINENFEGVIASVTSFGLFVELKDLYIEGLIHISQLGDYFTFDASKQRLLGERTRAVYRLGDTVNVTVESVDLQKRTINLLLEGTQKDAGKTRGSKNQGGKGRNHKKGNKGDKRSKGPASKKRSSSKSANKRKRKH